MTFPDSGAPFGADPLVIFALIVVVLITLFVLVFGTYLIFFSGKERNREDAEEVK